MLSKFCTLTAISAVAAVKQKSKCPFGYTSSSPSLVETSEEPEVTIESVALYPSDILTCDKEKKVLTTESFSRSDYAKLADEIIDLMEKKAAEDETPGDIKSDKVKFAACMLRLEGHDLMDFRRWRKSKKKRQGGSDGCVNFEDPDNAGLQKCLAWTTINTIYNDWCDKLSLADFMVIAGEVVVGRLATDYNAENPFGVPEDHDPEDPESVKRDSLLSKFRDQFEYGRTTLEKCPDNAAMPNPENGCDDLKAIFITHIFNNGQNCRRKKWERLASISGAHTIGHAKPENSGYDGFWGDPANQGVFNNDYYRNIMAHGWVPKRAVNGREDKNQW